MREFKTIIGLRRDTEAKFSQISFVPQKGEVILIDTVKKGLRAKVGDGVTLLSQLPYVDQEIYNEIERVVERGYYHNGQFYYDTTYQPESLIDPSLHRIYIDIAKEEVYTFDGIKYQSINDNLPKATDTAFGVVKLYSGKGDNIDGTMTQRSITNNLNTKVEASVEEETAIFKITL